MYLTHLALDSSPRRDAVLTCVLEVARRGLADRLGATLQANLLRSPVLRLGFRLAEAGATWSMATHDGRLRHETLDELSAGDVSTRVYVPYGPDWFRYWLRRLAKSRGT